ncbi:DUF4172 domain-containing protein [Alteromonas sp. a30]
MLSTLPANIVHSSAIEGEKLSAASVYVRHYDK